jgi:hypothetical protein
MGKCPCVVCTCGDDCKCAPGAAGCDPCAGFQACARAGVNAFVRVTVTDLYPSDTPGRPACIGQRYSIDVLLLDDAAGYALSQHSAVKELGGEFSEAFAERYPPVALPAAIQTAVFEANKRFAHAEAKSYEPGEQRLVLKQAMAQDGSMRDMALEVDASGHLVFWNEAHYPRDAEGPQRWTEVFFRLGRKPPEITAATSGATWIERKAGTSPYCLSLVHQAEHQALAQPD